MKSRLWPTLLAMTFVCACGEDSTATNPDPSECASAIGVDITRGTCSEDLSFVPEVNEHLAGGTRTVTANNIPDHAVGLFGRVPGALNPNAIREQNATYRLSAAPETAPTVTWLLGDNGASIPTPRS